MLTLLALPGSRAADGPHAAPERLRVRVLRTFPHDPGAFTQGLLLHEGKLYESTGMYGHSSLRRLDPRTGAVEKKVPLESRLFGEGLARVDGRLYQITWKEQRALVWDLATLERKSEFGYEGEGWGLCYDGRSLVMSDGSSRLVWRDPATFQKTAERVVKSGGRPVEKLNELECVGGAIYANIWFEPTIARIDAASGDVTAWIDASGLLTPQQYQAADVLNGIAHVPGTDRFIITGKYWPKSFEVEFVPAGAGTPSRPPSPRPRS
jgi:glutaminyl-peptide cyclotransferase